MDPSQRKLLEVTYDAFDNAQDPFEKFFGSKTGVFVGNFNNDHQLMQFRDPELTLPYAVTGAGPTILSNRINHVFNLQGPRDCDAAIVAGANLILGPDAQIYTTKLGAVSPTSRCHTFDAAADGYARAEGFGAIYLKRLSDAIAQGNPIRAVVRGTSVNANGRTGGISHPSPEGQEAVIRQAYEAAGWLNPDLTGYVECHGTGTPVGDPLEMSALGKVFAPGRPHQPLLIGSIKPNLGHSEAASAMSQIMKAVLAMEHSHIPATIGIQRFNPAIDFESARVKVVTEMTPWPIDLLRRVSINSFGYGGANAHCILDHPSLVIPGYQLRGLPLSRREPSEISSSESGSLDKELNSDENDTGEIAAAYAAGHLRASEAIVIAYLRGQVVANNQRKGLMLAVGMGADQIMPFLEGVEDDLSIAAVNSPKSITLSGDAKAIAELTKKLDVEDIFNRVLRTGDNAYHSQHMLALGAAYENLVVQGLCEIESTTLSEPRRPFARWVSSVTPEEEAQAAHPPYWRRNLESQVRFSEAVEVLARDVPTDILIEIGPHPALDGPLRQIRFSLEEQGLTLPPCLASLRRDKHDTVSMLSLAGDLFLSNAPIDLVSVNATDKTCHDGIYLQHGYPCVDMPQYSFTYQETPLYFENRLSKEFRTRKHGRHDLLGAMVAGCSKFHPSWRNVLRTKDVPWLDDHKLYPHAVLPAAAYIAMAVEAARQMHHKTGNAPLINSFQLRDVAISSPLFVKNDELGTETLLNMERVALTNTNVMSMWYKFSISSVTPDGNNWTEHCSGTVSAETNETTIDQDQRLQIDPRSRSLDMRRWYQKFDEVGLQYGRSFQGLSGLQAYRGSNVAAANVALNPTVGVISGGESNAAKAMFPPAEIPPLTLHLFDSFSGYVLAGIKALLESQAKSEGTQRHDQFAALARLWARYPLCTEALSVCVEERARAIERISMELENIPEVKCLKKLHDNLDRVLDGSTNSAELLIEDDLLRELYSTGIAVRAGHIQLQRIVDLLAHKNPRMRILQIGAGTGGATSALLETLGSNTPFKRFQEYVFTDADGRFLSDAQTRLGGQSGVSFQVLDIQKDPGTQGLQRQSFDLVVALGSFSLLDDVPQVLGHIRTLLKDKGVLALLEVTHPRLGFEMLFDTLAGRWDRPWPTMNEATWCQYVGDQAISTVMLAANTTVEKFTTPSNPQRDVHIVYRDYPPPLAHSVDANLARHGFHAIYVDVLSHSVIPQKSSVLSLVDIENITLVNCDDAYFKSMQAIIMKASTIITAELVTRKFAELQTSEHSEKVDREYELRDGAFYIERLLPDESLNRQFRLRHEIESDVEQRPMQSLGPLRAKYKEPGLLSTLYFCPDTEFRRRLEDDWVEIKTEAIGLNMKDLAVATARYDSDNFSREIAGVVCQVGSAVTALKAGDPKIPDGESFVGAASMPVAYLSVIYALHHLARLSKGESVLIPSATGSLGLAALRVARHLGAEVYATVGNDKKREALMKNFGMPGSRIFRSRDVTAVDDIMQATRGSGLDVILSTSVGDVMHETWRCIAPSGRFIDLARVDVLAGGKLGLDVFNRNATFSSFDIELLFRQKPALIEKLMKELMALWDEERAMTFLSKGQHIGKVVITFNNAESVLKVAKTGDRASFDPNSAYILVGCLGGLGRSVAVWMVERGARHLVFLSRSGVEKHESAQLVGELMNMGAEPQTYQCSVTDLDALVSLIGQVSNKRPIKGVIHAAMVEGDAPFYKANYSQIHAVLAPKVTGTINLHRATKHLPLDFFLMTSSIVATVGSATQSAYAAANAFQDSFARFRLSQALPATSLALGLILEVGSVSDSVEFQQILQRNITYGISETEFLQLVEAASGRLNDLVWYNNTRFQGVIQAISDRAQASGSVASTASLGGSSVSAKLREATSSAEKMEIARKAVTEKFASLFSIATDEIEVGRPMSEYGLDSLVAVELRSWLIKTFGVEVTPLQLLGKTTRIEDLVSVVCGGKNMQ
ncbi:hypothetical protein DL769_002188 [Monosporascus sp. CRB-8-3]|nr:hypothetical protein DL769_002188 [Monosporascus sp. CRB-8-3]